MAYTPDFPYKGEHIVVNSGRVFINARDDSAFINANKAVSLGSGGTLNFDSADKCIINSPRIDLGLGARHPVTRGDILKEILLDIVGDLRSAGAKMNTATGNHGAPITATQSAGKKLMKTKKSITAKLNRMNSDLTFTV